MIGMGFFFSNFFFKDLSERLILILFDRGFFVHQAPAPQIPPSFWWDFSPVIFVSLLPLYFWSKAFNFLLTTYDLDLMVPTLILIAVSFSNIYASNVLFFTINIIPLFLTSSITNFLYCSVYMREETGDISHNVEKMFMCMWLPYSNITLLWEG